MRYYTVLICAIIAFSSHVAWADCSIGNGPRDVTSWDQENRKITYSPVKKSSSRKDFNDTLTLVDWGLTLPEGVVGTDCTEGDKCVDYGVAKVVVTYEGNCEQIHWTSNELSELKDCLHLLGHWYGGGEQYTDPWPTEKVPWDEVPFVVSDKLSGSKVFGSVSEAYWVSSEGIAAKVDDGVPLFLSLPDNDDDGTADQMCFSSKYLPPFVAESTNSAVNLTYYLCYADDVRQVYELSYPTFFSYPDDIPDERMFAQPIWSTWAEYFKDVNVTRVMEMAQTIQSKGFTNSQIEIDDDWETCYGNAAFNLDKFPDPKGMIDDLHAMGFRVTIWVHPFINNKCESFAFADEQGYFVKGTDGLTSLTGWWDSVPKSAGAIDFTNSEAVDWWSSRLIQLMEDTGLDGFKFDAGEAYWLPEDYVLNIEKKFWPNGFTTSFVNAVGGPFGKILEVRVGHGSQKNHIFVRMLDKLSTWTDQNGLATLVPSLLHSSLIGYPFVLPDMIGGNAYAGKPSSELFARWAQANTFMPGIQFSLLPWEFDDGEIDVTQISLDVAELHEQYSPLLIELARNATLGLGPIARPTWWLCPTDEDCLVADQQFLLGDDLLVTPIVTEGATSIDVVFPPGSWEQADTGDVYEGVSKQTISGFTMNSNIYFKRV